MSGQVSELERALSVVSAAGATGGTVAAAVAVLAMAAGAPPSAVLATFGVALCAAPLVLPAPALLA